jgi:hypothetical protein
MKTTFPPVATRRAAARRSMSWAMTGSARAGRKPPFSAVKRPPAQVRHTKPMRRGKRGGRAAAAGGCRTGGGVGLPGAQAVGVDHLDAPAQQATTAIRRRSVLGSGFGVVSISSRPFNASGGFRRSQVAPGRFRAFQGRRSMTMAAARSCARLRGRGNAPGRGAGCGPARADLKPRVRNASTGRGPARSARRAPHVRKHTENPCRPLAPPHSLYIVGCVVL